MRQQLTFLALGLALSILGGAPASAASSDCLPALAAAEIRHQVPHGLLLSMALVESGRPDPASGRLVPWPWTVHSRDQGRFFDSESEAIEAAHRILASGDALIDVGCLQVDLFHHPAAFRTLGDAFDAAQNVDYAARYLSNLAHERGSWLEAVAAYNAGRPYDGVDYLSKVLYRWRGIRLTGRPTSFIQTSLP